ncbi:MAG TPA: SDR family oxidoreductase [Tepidisphaeraceae bacterium]|nr:SDR family oxidoreductase [Tepidisphaeraceae bacterium]
MSQRVAIITGAARGIGKAIAAELGHDGYDLVLSSRTKKELAEAAGEVGGGAVAFPADVTEPADVDALVAEALKRFGRIDAVVNNAGLAPVIAVKDMSIDRWRAVIDTNLSAAFYLSRAVWPTFEKQKAGVIVNISSLASRDPFPGFAAYAAAKAGLNMFGLALAREGQPVNVRVHMVAPGSVETAMFRSILSAEQWPTEKTLDPAEVARVVAQCIHGDLRHTSGEVIFVHKTL